MSFTLDLYKSAEYYNTVYVLKKEIVEPRIFTYIKNLLRPYDDVVDIGAGPGNMLKALLSFPLKYYTAIDFSPIALQRIEKICTPFHVETRCIDIETLTKPVPHMSSHSIYICTNIFEHLLHPEHIFQYFPIKTVLFSCPDFPAKAHVRYFETMDTVTAFFKKYGFTITTHDTIRRKTQIWYVGRAECSTF